MSRTLRRRALRRRPRRLLEGKGRSVRAAARAEVARRPLEGSFLSLASHIHRRIPSGGRVSAVQLQGPPHSEPPPPRLREEVASVLRLRDGAWAA